MISETKIVLSPYDDKRYIVPDSIATLQNTIVNKFVYYILYL